MKQIIFTAILIFVFCFATFGQTEEPQIEDFSPLDVYGVIPAKEEKVRLDFLFTNLSQNKNFEGIIILNFDKNTSKKRIVKRLKDIIKMINFRDFDINRITFIITAYGNAEETNLYILPENGSPINGLAEGNKTIKAEEFKQQINKIFPRK